MAHNAPHCQHWSHIDRWHRQRRSVLRNQRQLALRNKQKLFFKRALEPYVRVAEFGKRIGTVQGIVAPANEMAISVAGMCLVGFGGWRVAGGDISLPNLVTFLLFFGLLAAPLGSLSNTFVMTREGLSARRRLKDIWLSIAVDDRLPAFTSDAWSDPSQDLATGPVRFEAVCLGERLRDVDFTVPTGAFVAVVGESGAGKSSLLSLLSRLEDPSSGSVSIAGRDLRSYPLLSLRDRISVLEQENEVQHELLYDDMQGGTQSANARLVEGFASRDFETLSGGQKQRRALLSALKADCDLMILDEPSASLDAISERLVVELINERQSSCTAFVASHRWSTLEGADMVLVLDHGKLEDCGPPEAVFARSAVLRKLFSSQIDTISPVSER